jgi:DegV family protein with EDD domain
MPTDAVPVLITDSSCDLPPETLTRLGVVSLTFPVILDGREYMAQGDEPLTNADFYARVREGATPSTAAIPIPTYVECFERFAAEGTPAVFIGLSAALSGTFEAMHLARATVLEAHPDAVITIVDSLNASTALGLLVLETAERIAAGAGHDHVVAWLDDSRTLVNGYFTVDTLEYLRRGGRVSDVAALAGTVLDIKPVLSLDPSGAIVPTDRVRGRKKSLRALAEICARRIDRSGGGRVGIGNGDALADAETLRDLVLERMPDAEIVMTEVGPVIGSHTGPGMVSIVFMGQRR